MQQIQVALVDALDASLIDLKRFSKKVIAHYFHTKYIAKGLQVSVGELIPARFERNTRVGFTLARSHRWTWASSRSWKQWTEASIRVCAVCSTPCTTCSVSGGWWKRTQSEPGRTWFRRRGGWHALLNRRSTGLSTNHITCFIDLDQSYFSISNMSSPPPPDST